MNTQDIELPPLPKGDIAADTCPVMWVHSNAQLQAYARAAVEAYCKRIQPDPTTLKNLHTLTLDQLRGLAMRDCSEYSSDDLAIAWELFARLVEGGRIIEADRQR